MQSRENTAKTIAALCEQLRANQPELTSIDLSQFEIPGITPSKASATTEEVMALLTALETNTTVTNLNLSGQHDWNQLSIKLQDLLAGNTLPLKTLTCNSNTLTAEFLLCLVDGLDKNETLEVLKLRSYLANSRDAAILDLSGGNIAPETFCEKLFQRTLHDSQHSQLKTVIINEGLSDSYEYSPEAYKQVKAFNDTQPKGHLVRIRCLQMLANTENEVFREHLANQMAKQLDLIRLPEIPASKLLKDAKDALLCSQVLKLPIAEAILWMSFHDIQTTFDMEKAEWDSYVSFMEAMYKDEVISIDKGFWQKLSVEAKAKLAIVEGVLADLKQYQSKKPFLMFTYPHQARAKALETAISSLPLATMDTESVSNVLIDLLKGQMDLFDPTNTSMQVEPETPEHLMPMTNKRRDAYYDCIKKHLELLTKKPVIERMPVVSTLSIVRAPRHTPATNDQNTLKASTDRLFEL